ncbi:MAG: ANTAR domain-containing response regulator [Candidatus Ornithomonoglobus sp.]
MKRIILAFSQDQTAMKIRSMLDGSGFETDNAVCHSAAELLRAIDDYDEALIIMGFKLPDMVADEVCENLHSGCKLMAIVRAEHVDDIDNDEIFILPLPVTRQRLISSINVFLGHIPEHRKKGARSPEENKLIEKAKLFLIERYHMTEQQAHRFIQKRSMDTGARTIDTARTILNIDGE